MRYNLGNWIRFTAIVISGLHYAAESSEDIANADLNLYEVLNTHHPLFLFELKSRSPVERNCTGYTCLIETRTCEHMRQITLGPTIYHFKVSTTGDLATWRNESFLGQFVMNTTPPYEMDVYKFQNPEEAPHYLWELKYNEPNTYNCSVFYIYNQTTDSSGDSTCALYVRGVPGKRVNPTLDCQISFNNCSESRVVFKPYIDKCSKLVPDR
ncbi:uncharacterized protein LOC119402930 [Rhipicephalus sanguineus]|uniref:uncharacterized protein LOC119402930 n=1 Tax=Rhipicephalus sanguineus TaxID=34632 RepID=UPI00189311C5|nr:uncharacterized protein LOC119402930 [Rhipicephalus sanguineus]